MDPDEFDRRSQEFRTRLNATLASFTRAAYWCFGAALALLMAGLGFDQERLQAIAYGLIGADVVLGLVIPLGIGAWVLNRKPWRRW